jgi:class 3 adenylate cyclase
MVGSTALSELLDPEELRDLLTSYQRVCRDAIGRYEGHTSQFLGDGVMSYFGYPIAHEDDAVRAVRASLRILDGIKLVNEGIGKRLGVEIHVRAGIHTGIAVVGEIGPGGAHDRLAVGEAVNLAARIQSFAEMDSIVVSAPTARLIRGHFELHPLDVHILKGFTRPVDLFRVLRPTDARTTLEASALGGLTPHVGRDDESAELASVWRDVRVGADRVVVVRGEAGIGKSRIVHQFRNTVLAEPVRVLECFCSPLTQATALAPIIAMLERVVQERSQSYTPALSKIEALRSLLGDHLRLGADALPLVATLLSVPGADSGPIEELSPIRRGARTLEILREWMASSAERAPLALLVEDAHWADPSTLDLLDLLVRKSPGGRTLICVTCRPEFVTRWSQAHVQTIELGRLSGEQVEAIVTHVAGGHPLPPLVVRQIAERSEGVPLFVEEVTKAVLESDALCMEADRYELSRSFDESPVPSTVHASLLARFDRLGESRAIAQLGAAIGREFTYPLIRAIAGMPDAQLREHLDRLCRSELAFSRGDPPDATYTFKHALIQDAIYGTLLKKERLRVHESVFSKLRAEFPEITEARPEMTAHHAENAGLRDLAVPLLKEAGLRAFGRVAVVEAVKHLSRAIELVGALDEPARTDTEIELQSVIGPAYMATMGWTAPEVERSSARLRDLAISRGDGAKLFQAIWGLWSVHFLRGEMDLALAASKQVLEMALATPDPMLQLAGHGIVGYTLLYRGEYLEALRHAELGLSSFDVEREKKLAHLFQISPSVTMWSYGALIHCILGLPEKAAEWSQRARDLAATLRHPPSLAYGHCAQFRILRWMDDVDQVRENAAAARSLAAAEGFALWVPMADIYLAWSDARRGDDPTRASNKIGAAITSMKGNVLFAVEDGTLHAETLLLAGQPEAVFAVAAEIMAIIEKGGQRHCEPELFRLQGEAAASLGQRDRAEAFFRKGIERASEMGAKAIEQRAAASLASLLGGKPTKNGDSASAAP